MQLRKTLRETDNKGGLKKHGMNAGWGGVGKRRPTAFLGSSHQKNNDDEDLIQTYLRNLQLPRGKLARATRAMKKTMSLEQI